MIFITVKHRETGVPIAGQQLSLEFEGETVGWTKLVETDQAGEACFNVAPVAEATLFINGNRFYRGGITDGVVVFLGE